MFLKPDRLNGKAIFRGVDRDGAGINHVNRIVLFPPTMTSAHGPILSNGELAELALSQIVSVSDRTGDAVIKAQAVAFRGELRKTLGFWIRRAALNERERCRQALVRHGLELAASAIGDENG